MRLRHAARRFTHLELGGLETDLADDATWAGRNLPCLRGALLLLRRSTVATRGRYLALGEEGPAVIQSSLHLLDTRIAHLSQLLRLLTAARARLSRLDDGTTSETALARHHPRRRTVAKDVAQPKAPR